MSVIETFERAIEHMVSERDSASTHLSDLINRHNNLKAEIASLDTDIEAHYAAIGRHCLARLTIPSSQR
jgi:hypothetical protein